MKVLIVTNTFPPQHTGSGILTLRVCNYLSKKYNINFEVLNVTSRSKEKIKYSIGNIIVHTIYINPKYGRLINLVNLVLSIKFFFKRKASSFDIFHGVTISWATLYFSLLAKKKDIPFIMESTLLGDAVSSQSPFVPKFLHLIKEKYKVKMLLNIGIFKTVSEVLSKELRSIGVNTKNIFCIPPPVDTLVFKRIDQNKRIKLRKSLNIPENSKVILFVGGFMRRKGVDIVIDSYCKLKDKNKFLVLVSPKSEEDKFYKEQMIKLSKEEFLLINHKVNNVYEYMQSADIFLFPSRKEGFGAVITESMSSGCIAISSYLEGITESQIKDGENGFVVRDNDYLSIIQHVFNLSENEKNKIIDTASSFVKNNYSEEIVGDVTRQLYLNNSSKNKNHD